MNLFWWVFKGLVYRFGWALIVLDLFLYALDRFPKVVRFGKDLEMFD